MNDKPYFFTIPAGNTGLMVSLVDDPNEEEFQYLDNLEKLPAGVERVYYCRQSLPNRRDCDEMRQGS